MQNHESVGETGELWGKQGVKEGVLEDAINFMVSKEWYSERGIPFRCGYLLVSHVQHLLALLKLSLTSFSVPAPFEPSEPPSAHELSPATSQSPCILLASILAAFRAVWSL